MNTVALGAGLRALFWVVGNQVLRKRVVKSFFFQNQLSNVLVYILHGQISSLTLGFGVIACANEMLKSINLLVIITISFTALKTSEQQ